MAVITELSEGDAAALARAFDLGEVRALRAIPAGTINSNYALTTSRGAYFLRINEGKDEADVRWEAELLRELAGAGVPVAAPHRASSGEAWAPVRGKLASLFSWLEGEHRARDEVSAMDARAVGRALAELHGAGRPLASRFERSGIYTFADITARFEGFRDRDDPALAPAIRAIADEIPWLEARAAIRAEAPQGVIHGDLFRDNVLFRGRELAALLDFEQASTGSLAYDLAVCLNAWCFTSDVDPELSRGLLAGYQALRPLGEAARAALYPELRAAAMRFAVTRVTDVYLAGADQPGKDFRRYLRRLERWRELGAGEVDRWIGESAAPA